MVQSVIDRGTRMAPLCEPTAREDAQGMKALWAAAETILLEQTA